MKTFPMFLKMENRRVLIIGGGEQAAQKTRLILKTEAEICVLANHLCSELETLANTNRITHLTGDLTIELLHSAILTFSATGCAGASAAHAALAKQANSIINVVDMPTLCEAMTPSIVDRDPLVIAIGTEGNAPILGRQTKSKIETILEPGLGRLVAFAGSMRKDVSHNIAEKQRRSFWNWVFNEKPRREFNNGNERRAFDIIKQEINKKGLSNSKGSKTTVIEAFSKNPDLLRLRDVKNLQEADIIFYESGFHEDILELARRDALRQNYLNLSETLSDIEIHSDYNDSNIVIITSQPVGRLKKPIHLKVIA